MTATYDDTTVLFDDPNYTFSGEPVSSGVSASAAEIASAVLAVLQSTAIPVNVERVHGAQLAGSGVPLDPWRPV